MGRGKGLSSLGRPPHEAPHASCLDTPRSATCHARPALYGRENRPPWGATSAKAWSARLLTIVGSMRFRPFRTLSSGHIPNARVKKSSNMGARSCPCDAFLATAQVACALPPAKAQGTLSSLLERQNGPVELASTHRANSGGTHLKLLHAMQPAEAGPAPGTAAQLGASKRDANVACITQTRKIDMHAKAAPDSCHVRPRQNRGPLLAHSSPKSPAKVRANSDSTALERAALDS